jgi:hypothetical protein
MLRLIAVLEDSSLPLRERVDTGYIPLANILVQAQDEQHEEQVALLSRLWEPVLRDLAPLTALPDTALYAAMLAGCLLSDPAVPKAPADLQRLWRDAATLLVQRGGDEDYESVCVLLLLGLKQWCLSAGDQGCEQLLAEMLNAGLAAQRPSIRLHAARYL